MFETVAHTQLQHINRVYEEINMSTDDGFSSDEERKEEEVILLALLLNRKRKIWVHNINKKRNVFGEFHHLFDDLEDRFYTYF